MQQSIHASRWQKIISNPAWAGLGVYMPYVAIHAIVFERLIAITREKANVGFLMYIVDSVGYTGYIILMLFRYLAPSTASILSIFIKICIYMGIAGVLLVLFCFLYFKFKLNQNEQKYPFGDLVEKEYDLNEVEEAFEFASISKPVRVGVKITDAVK